MPTTQQSDGTPLGVCPACGGSVSGKFCSHCGTPVLDASCPSCRAPLNPGARFCHLCGAPLGARRSRGAVAPWLIAGGAITALVAVLVVVALRDGNSAASGTQPVPATTSGAAAVDLSSMTPREQADRLYERIMRAHERGDTNEIRFFKPMALQAYARLGALDDDAHYHIGLIHALTGDPAAALARADSMSEGNLLALMLRQQVAMAVNDAAASQRAYRAFLANYERELATNRPEYAAHRSLIESFVVEARRQPGAVTP